MLKYCFVKENGLVQLGVGCNEEYYIEIGMTLEDVEQSEIDNEWYLTDKCPHYTEEEKKQIEEQQRINTIQNKLSQLDDLAIQYIINKDDKAIQIIKDIKAGLQQTI